MIKNSISKRGTNICKVFKKTKMYILCKPKIISVLSHNFAEHVYVKNTYEINFVILNTVEHKKIKYYQRQIELSETAIAMCGKIEYSSLNYFKKIAKMKLISN